MKVKIGQVYKLKPGIDIPQIAQFKVLGFRSDYKIFATIQVLSGSEAGYNDELNINTIKELFELDPAYVAVEQFDKDLKELLNE